jgi:hypothetical protein
MATSQARMQPRSTHSLRVEAFPSEADAGAELTLKAELSGLSAADLQDRTLLIADEHGTRVQTFELGTLDAASRETPELIVNAPVAPGRYTWRAVLQGAGGPDNDASAMFSFVVKPHDLQLVVWDVPSAIKCGAPFSIKLGVKCSASCRPDGWAVEVRDHDGKVRATALVGDDPWPGTEALYATELELRAPTTEALHEWSASTRLADLDEAHNAAGTDFGVRAVPAPECLLTVIAIDKDSGAAIERTKVVAHPYRAFTDARGTATLELPRGTYRVFVSGKGYAPFRSDVELVQDSTLTAALVLDGEPSDADVWA